MNKLAAGALALALGLGAVAPAVAAESKSYTGAQLFVEQYEREVKTANALREKALVAEAKIAEAEANYKAAEKALEAAKKAYEAKFPELKAYANPEGAKIADLKPMLQGALAATQNLNKGYTQTKLEALIKVYEDALDAAKKDKNDKTPYATAEKALRDNITDTDADLKKSEHAELAADQYSSRVDVIVEQIIYVVSHKDSVSSSKEYKAYVAAQYNYSLTKEVLAEVKAKYQGDIDDYKAALKSLKDKAEGYGYIVQVGNNGLKLVKDGEAKVVAPDAKKDNLAELKRAKADAETAIKAVKLLKELSPEKIKKVEAKLNEKVMKAEALIKKVDAKIAELEKKTAFIATAYADEAKEDDTDALIKELDQTTGEIKDLIKDTPEDKKANEEKKPEEKKPEDKKEEKTPSKKAGNNAKTGIAGVAGVAGILAAASVAYAASKRD